MLKITGNTQKQDISEELVQLISHSLEEIYYLGFDGVLFYMEDVILKVMGNFPKLHFYVEEVIPNTNSVSIYFDRYLLIPVFGDTGKGVLAVYKHDKLDKSNLKYLKLYVNYLIANIDKLNYKNQAKNFSDLLNETLESLGIGIAIIDQKGIVEIENSVFKELLKLDKKEDIFKPSSILTILEREIKEAISKKEKFETICSFKDLDYKSLSIKVFPMESSKKKEEDITHNDKYIILIEDITKKEEIEAQVLQTEKLTIIGKLTAGISHDIRNPLAVISQATFNIKREAKKIENEKIIRYSERIEKNVNRATEIIEKLLNFSKQASKRKEVLNLKSLIEESLDLALIETDLNNLFIYKYLDSDVYIFGDKNALIQVFVNLILNALESMNYKGTLIIELKKENHFAVIKIKDTGKGIPNRIKEHIFEPFFTTKEDGTGLGLAISKNIIEDHNGTIKFKSEEGKGTTFEIKFLSVEV